MGLAAVTNGFVMNDVNLTDGGYGHTNTPLVRFVGGGGSGAQGSAVISNGVVTGIIVTNAGSGYTNAPVVAIAPPFISHPVLGIAPMLLLAFSNLTVGGTYQLQRSLAWYWANQPVNFTATNALYTQMVAGVIGSGDYRLGSHSGSSPGVCHAPGGLRVCGWGNGDERRIRLRHQSDG